VRKIDAVAVLVTPDGVVKRYKGAFNMSAFTPIPSLEQLDIDAYYDERDRQEEAIRCGQNEPPAKYPGFRNVPDDVLRKIVADPWPLAPGDEPEVMIEEARAELERRHPQPPAGYADAVCKCGTAIYVREGTGGSGVCPACARQVA
jgi:hypothetical protein